MQKTTQRSFPFRPWVRSTCQRAMSWGLGVLALLAVVIWWLRAPGEETLTRPFEVLLLYGLVFWLSLLKIWWTGRQPAVVLDEERLSYQPLHTFRRRHLRFDRILSCAPRPGSQSLGFVVQNARRRRQFFLNLGVIQNRHALMDLLGQRLQASGLEGAPESEESWRRPDSQADPEAPSPPAS